MSEEQQVSQTTLPEGAGSEPQSDTMADIQKLQEQLRKIQSSKDSEVAQANRRAQQIAEELETLRAQNQSLIESIKDPEVRNRLARSEEARKQEAAQRELQFLRYKSYLVEQGIPLSAMQGCETAQDLAQAERQYYASRVAELEAEVKRKREAEAVEEKEKSGALDVQTSTSPAADGVPLGRKSLEDEILEEKSKQGRRYNASYEYIKRSTVEPKKGAASAKV